MTASKNLSVYLNEIFVGELTQFIDGRTFLAFAESYLSNSERPVLSLSYKNVVNDIQTHVQPPVMGLPTFFSHLLPEGSLRKYLAQKAGVKETQDFRLLVALKDDLPGAVFLKSYANEPSPSGGESDEDEAKRSNQPLRFSLAGIQMKFSGDLTGDKLAIPASGVGGHWIVKLPSTSYPNVVELEYSMLTLAQNIGISVPEFRLLPTAEIQNLPADLPEALQGDTLISQRFDRIDNGGRIHMEDFAQVFAVRDKYDVTLNYQSIASVIWQEIGIDAVLEFLRRLVHMILTGNADMHLKNWSLIYPDGMRAKLAPAYDLVSTVVYADIVKTLPHKIAAVRDFQNVDIETFKQFAKIAGLPERPVINTVIETVDLLKQQWTGIKNDLPLPSSFIRIIDEHMRHVPLAVQRATGIALTDPIPRNMTWPGSFFNWQIELDNSLSAGKIVFRNQAGTTLEMDAPRRMNQVLLQKQMHKILADHRDFSNQLIVGQVGEDLYNEWRQENFPRIEGRMVEGGLTERMLLRHEMNIRAAFFPVDWRDIQKRFKNAQQFFEIDFVLDNGEVWTAEATIKSLGKGEISTHGSRVADLSLYSRGPRRLYVISPEKRLTFGSGRFSISKAKLDQIQEPTSEDDAT